MTIKTLAAVMATLLLTATVTTVEARGFRCGATQMAHYGITDTKYRLAKAWLDQPRVASCAPGVVVVQTRNGRDSAGNPGGHVSRVVSCTSQCHAIVADEKGQYQRDICSRLVAYVQPGAVASHGRVQHASYSATDRHSTR